METQKTIKGPEPLLPFLRCGFSLKFLIPHQKSSEFPYLSEWFFDFLTDLTFLCLSDLVQFLSLTVAPFQISNKSQL